MNDNVEISTTGGKIISGREAAEMLDVSYPYLYKLMDKGVLKRADRPNRLKTRQPLRFFEADIKQLLDEGLPEENPKNAAIVAA